MTAFNLFIFAQLLCFALCNLSRN